MYTLAVFEAVAPNEEETTVWLYSQKYPNQDVTCWLGMADDANMKILGQQHFFFTDLKIKMPQWKIKQLIYNMYFSVILISASWFFSLESNHCNTWGDQWPFQITINIPRENSVTKLNDKGCNLQSWSSEDTYILLDTHNIVAKEIIKYSFEVIANPW